MPHERDPDGRATGFLVPHVQEEVISGWGLNEFLLCATSRIPEAGADGTGHANRLAAR
jgi:hypothetical protein